MVIVRERAARSATPISGLSLLHRKQGVSTRVQMEQNFDDEAEVCPRNPFSRTTFPGAVSLGSFLSTSKNGSTPWTTRTNTLPRKVHSSYTDLDIGEAKRKFQLLQPPHKIARLNSSYGQSNRPKVCRSGIWR